MKQLESAPQDIAADLNLLEIPPKLQGTVYAYIDGICMVEDQTQNLYMFLTIVNLLRQNPTSGVELNMLSERYIALASRAFLSYREFLSSEIPF